MTVYVDADGCPVTRIVEGIAKKYDVPVTLLCDTNHVLSSDNRLSAEIARKYGHRTGSLLQYSMNSDSR